MKQRESGLPFDDFRNLVKSLPPANEDAVQHTAMQLAEHQSNSSKVRTLCEWYSRWSGRSPIVHRPLMTLFGGTHALTSKLDMGSNAAWLLDNVSEVAEGSNAINRLCHQQDMGLKLFDLALQVPVADISEEPGLDEKSCAGTIAFGMEAIAGGADLLAVCAIEQEVNSSVAAILSILCDQSVEALFAPINQSAPELLPSTLQAVEQAKAHASNPLEVLRRLGGRETAAICGAILAARTEHIPTVVGGATGLAALAVLKALDERAVAHCVFASDFSNATFSDILSKLELTVVLDSSFSESFGADVTIATGVLKSAFKHFPVADQATRS